MRRRAPSAQAVNRPGARGARGWIALGRQRRSSPPRMQVENGEAGRRSWRRKWTGGYMARKFANPAMTRLPSRRSTGAGSLGRRRTGAAHERGCGHRGARWLDEAVTGSSSRGRAAPFGGSECGEEPISEEMKMSGPRCCRGDCKRPAAIDRGQPEVRLFEIVARIVGDGERPTVALLRRRKRARGWRRQGASLARSKQARCWL